MCLTNLREKNYIDSICVFIGSSKCVYYNYTCTLKHFDRFEHDFIRTFFFLNYQTWFDSFKLEFIFVEIFSGIRYIQKSSRSFIFKIDTQILKFIYNLIDIYFYKDHIKI